MRARKGKVVKENSERWLLTYSDLITLLMIFFIILYAMSSTNVRKFEDLTGALQKAFNNGTFQIVQIGGTKGSPKVIAAASQSERKTLKLIKSQLAALLKRMGVAQNVVHVGMTREGIDVTLAGDLLFYPGDVVLLPRSYALLGRIAEVLQHLPNQIRVEGNTDNRPSINPVYSSNWALSAMRAIAIVQHLIHDGIAPSRLDADGRGQYHPVTRDNTPLGWARNRRADIIILYSTH